MKYTITTSSGEKMSLVFCGVTLQDGLNRACGRAVKFFGKDIGMTIYDHQTKRTIKFNG